MGLGEGVSETARPIGPSTTPGCVSIRDAATAVGVDVLSLTTAALAIRPREMIEGGESIREIEVPAGFQGPWGPSRPGDRWLAIVERTDELVEVVATPAGTAVEAADNGMGC